MTAASVASRQSGAFKVARIVESYLRPSYRHVQLSKCCFADQKAVRKAPDHSRSSYDVNCDNDVNCSVSAVLPIKKQSGRRQIAVAAAMMSTVLTDINCLMLTESAAVRGEDTSASTG